MSLNTTRTKILQHSALGKTAVLLIVVAAIVAGLLAMHTFTATAGNHDDGAGMSMSALPTENSALQREPVPPVVCSGSCTPEHAMGAMACILALLVGVLMLSVAAGYLGALLDRLRVIASSLLGAAAATTLRSPPDLIALSISRT